MLHILAYIIVIPLTNLVLSLGVGIGTVAALPISIIGYIFPKPFRDSVIVPVGLFFTGVVGVGCSVAFGYFVFRWLTGPSSFTIGPFLAATIPLVIPIRNDLNQARRMDASRQELISGLQETRGLEQAQAVAAELPSNRPVIFGYFTGLLLATFWFFNFN